jgi:hypothetical protein
MQAIWGIAYWEQQNLLPLRKKDNKFYNQVHSQVLGLVQSISGIFQKDNALSKVQKI